ncbi:CD83 antigen [Pelmatolapia mariae]|uniref:CD83 antigen n=1 Tax=Pelmatolapia mariae TaxID=158779 RepID=UPI002FE509F2
MISVDFLGFLLLFSQGVWLAVGAAVKEDTTEVVVLSSEDSILPCKAKFKSGVQYLAVRWYKVSESPSSARNGLLTRDLPDGTTRWYAGVERDVALVNETHGILLADTTCSDAGVYMCHLAAPVGEQNQDGYVRLVLTDCPAAPTDSLERDDYLIIFASVVIMIALLLSFISYVCLTNGLRERNKQQQQEQTTKEDFFLNKPVEPKDLKLIYTLGPKPSTKTVLCV